MTASIGCWARWVTVSWALLRGWAFSAWTTPATWAVDQLVTADDLNTHLRDNLNALKSPPSAHYEGDGGDYSTNSTSFVDVDSVNMALTITTSGGDVMIGFSGSISHNVQTGHVYFDVAMDGDRIGGDDGMIMQGAYYSGGVPTQPVQFVRLQPGVSAASHTFKLQWKVGSGTVTLYAGAGAAGSDVHPQFWVREVS